MPATYTTRRSVAMTPLLRARLQQLLDKPGQAVNEAARTIRHHGYPGFWRCMIRWQWSRALHSHSLRDRFDQR